MWESDPLVYSNLVEILRKEAKEGSSRKPKSCSRAALWLTRYVRIILVHIYSKLNMNPQLFLNY